MEDKFKKYQGLIELTQTTEDVVKLDREIDLLLQSIYHLEKDMFEDILKTMVRLRVAAEITRLIQESMVSKKEEIKALLADAYKTICSLPILRLTLAFEPSETVIGNLSRFARQNLSPGILLDLSLDKSIIGGAGIDYQGKFYDFTLKKKLNEIFEKEDLRLS